jgi:hypothetical protein
MCGFGLKGSRREGYHCLKCHSHFSARFVSHMQRLQLRQLISKHFDMRDGTQDGTQERAAARSAQEPSAKRPLSATQHFSSEQQSSAAQQPPAEQYSRRKERTVTRIETEAESDLFVAQGHDEVKATLEEARAAVRNATAHLKEVLEQSRLQTRHKQPDLEHLHHAPAKTQVITPPVVEPEEVAVVPTTIPPEMPSSRPTLTKVIVVAPEPLQRPVQKAHGKNVRNAHVNAKISKQVTTRAILNAAPKATCTRIPRYKMIPGKIASKNKPVPKTDELVPKAAARASARVRRAVAKRRQKPRR